MTTPSLPGASDLVQAYESGGPLALAAVTMAIVAVIWAARREFKGPAAKDPIAEAIEAQTAQIAALTKIVNEANLARVAHEAQTDTTLREHERRLNTVEGRLDRRRE